MDGLATEFHLKHSFRVEWRLKNGTLDQITITSTYNDLDKVANDIDRWGYSGTGGPNLDFINPDEQTLVKLTLS